MTTPARPLPALPHLVAAEVDRTEVKALHTLPRTQAEVRSHTRGHSQAEEEGSTLGVQGGHTLGGRTLVVALGRGQVQVGEVLQDMVLALPSAVEGRAVAAAPSCLRDGTACRCVAWRE